MKIDVVPLPRMLTDEHVRDRVVVVFDVLRATTTIAAALSAGASEIRVFDSLNAARSAAAEFSGGKLLCGESKCLTPLGFDLGNSPSAYLPELVIGKTLFLSTTNGTRALVAARQASLLLTGALVNAQPVAKVLADRHQDVTLLCAGTDGEIAPEDMIGAGAVLMNLLEVATVEPTPVARAAIKLFNETRHSLLNALSKTTGGQNVIGAGIADDVAFAARLDVFSLVPRCDGITMTIRPMDFS